MNSAKWVEAPYDNYFFSRIGNMCLGCYGFSTSTGKYRWYAVVYVSRISMCTKRGVMRHSLEKAKEDAIRMAEELLIDLHVGIENEMKACGIDPGLL